MLFAITKSHKCPIMNSSNFCIQSACHRFIRNKCQHDAFERMICSKRGTKAETAVRISNPAKQVNRKAGKFDKR